MTAISPAGIRIALLGAGNVGGAVAELAARRAYGGRRFSIVSALVRDRHRQRPGEVGRLPLTSDPMVPLTSRPDVVLEVLGGLEPARTLVLDALSRGLPVVTANKSLLAAHGDELFAAAAETGTPLLYEASVLAGVPFLGMFNRRPLARNVTAIAGILNGTSNFVLSRMLGERLSFSDALRAAQREGYAEPDPANDVNGADSAEKLAVLVRHFANRAIRPTEIERTAISDVDLEDLRTASSFGGRIRPVALAEWRPDDSGDEVAAFTGPAFVDGSNGLARIDGVQNAVALSTQWSGTLCFSGPGAGPMVTAATLLDDVGEALMVHPSPHRRVAPRAQRCLAPATGWFIRLTSSAMQNDQEAPGLLAGLGVRIRRISPVETRGGIQRQWLLTQPCGREHLSAALDVLRTRKRTETWQIRAID